jgi:DNA-binding beta-propeller fold protein YncE
MRSPLALSQYLLAATIAAATLTIAPRARAEETGSDTVYVYRAVSAFNLYLYQGSIGIPAAVVVDSKNHEVWVADTGKDIVGVFADNGVSLFAFGSEELLRQPQRLAVSPSGELFVVEGKRDRIRRFSYRGEYRGDVPLEKFREEPSIGAIAFDSSGNLYVSENNSGQIFVYNSSGRLRYQFGGRGIGDGQFLSVTAIAIGQDDGAIYVADQQGIPVQSFDNQGNYLTGWGRHDMGRENFALPSGIAVNSKGYVIVSDELRHDVKTYDRSGHVIQLFGGQGPGLGAFSFPTNISVDAEDRLYVAERGNKRVQIFELVPVKRTPPPAAAPEE